MEEKYMTLALITAKQVIVLFILIFSGFICVKTGAVKIEGRKSFSDLLVYFVVPCMIINSYIIIDLYVILYLAYQVLSKQVI